MFNKSKGIRSKIGSVGRSFKFSSARLCVRPSVTLFFLRVAHYIFFFFLKIGLWLLSEIIPDDTVKSGLKWLYQTFKGNSYYTQNWVNRAFYGLKSRLSFSLNLFIGFCKIIPDDKHEKWVKVTVLDFRGKVILCPNRKNGSLLSQKLTVLNFSLNQFIIFYLITSTKESLKRSVLDF